MTAVTVDRWRTAQGAELSFWTGMELHELVTTFADKLEFWSRFSADELAALIRQKDVLEIGCGPLGLSIVSFSGNGAEARRLVKADPLPQINIADTHLYGHAWTGKLFEWIGELAAQGEYLQIAGEDIALDACFDTVVSYNVLDHVREPATILRNAYRALRPGGTLVIGVDCLSMLGKARFELITRRRAKGSILVEAHPHTFLPGDVDAMVRGAGFTMRAVRGVPGGTRRLLGRHFRPAFVAVK